MKYALKLCTLIAAILLAGCAFLTKPSTAGPSPLVVASCPPKLPLLADGADTFGDTTAKLVEVAGIYYECTAAIGIRPP